MVCPGGVDPQLSLHAGNCRQTAMKPSPVLSWLRSASLAAVCVTGCSLRHWLL